MDSRSRAIAAGIEAFGRFLAGQVVQDKEVIDTKALEGRLESLEKSCLSLEEKARLEEWPHFIHELILSGEIKATIVSGLARHRTVSQIASDIRELAVDLENHFERR